MNDREVERCTCYRIDLTNMTTNREALEAVVPNINCPEHALKGAGNE